MIQLPGMKTDRKEKMTREESFTMVEKWVDETRSRVYGKDLEELQDILWISVVDERLKLDENIKRNFIYKLEEPIEKLDGSGDISIFKISPSKMNKVFQIEDKKSTSERSTSLIQTYCKDSESNEIPVGFITRLDPRDSIVIQAIINAFFF